MPNWCYNYITINNEDKKELEKLNNLIEEWTSKDHVENGFGLNWLGNIVGNSGIDTWDEEKHNFSSGTRCRGTLVEYNLDEEELLITTETAWCPMIQMWIKILEKYSPTSSLVFDAEEPGNEIYVTNDDYYRGLYYIDSCRDDYDFDREANEDIVRELIQKLCNTEETDIEVLMEIFKQSEQEDIWIHEWDMVELEDCE